MTEHEESAAARLDDAVTRYPFLADRIHRGLLIALHQRGIASVDEIYARARGGEGGQRIVDDNVQQVRRLDAVERRAVWEQIRLLAGKALTVQEIDDIVLLTRKREEAASLEEIAGLPAVSFGLLAERVKAFCRIPRGQAVLTESESMAARVALIRHFISDQLEFIGVAKHHLTIRHFDDLVDRIIGSESGIGRIGGKAAGMLLARAILDGSGEPGEDPLLEIPESFYVRSDVLDQVLRQGGLVELQDQKYKDTDKIRREYPLIMEVLKNADFPPEVVDQLRRMLERAGEHPLIVRSSSLLEDRFGAAFAGKYRSVFLPNQGPLETRLRELLGGIAEVYASTLHADPISYRRRRDLLDYDEGMAVLIQKVVGRRVGDYFLPVWAGVGFSRNEYRRAPRVRPEDGMARLVLGLGTRAVDRVGADCPRVMALGLPLVRPEVGPVEIARHSQASVDVINLAENRFETLPVEKLFAAGECPGLEQVVSIWRDGLLSRPPGRMLLASPDELVVTFDRFAGDSPYPELLRRVLQTLEAGYGCPVDIEVAFDGERLHLLQCRPQALRKTQARVHVPEDVPPEQQVFSAHRDLESGSVRGVEYIVIIDPRDYDGMRSTEERLAVARAVRALNDRLAGRSFALLGPGRWGSKDARMGIRVSYADIDNARVLIEIARARGGMVPEVSFGSHFFQDLVEADILYMPLYPEEPESLFDEEFLHGSPNLLGELVPEHAELGELVRVIDVAAASGGRLLAIDVDAETQVGLGYLV